jgi:hypothetical protein
MHWNIFAANPVDYPGVSLCHAYSRGSEYMIHYVHRIRPKASDVLGPVRIPDNAFSNKKTLAKALRDICVLPSGGRLSTVRVEGDKVIAFPTSGVWHAFVITLA